MAANYRLIYICILTVSISVYIFSMAKTIEKYERHTYAEQAANQSAKDTQSSYEEYLKLKSKFEHLQSLQRQLLGEDLGELGIKELEKLERQLDMSVGQIRLLKTHSMLDRLSELQKKEEMLLETNNVLKRKLDDIDSALKSWEAGDQSITYSLQPAQTSKVSTYPLQCNGTLQIGYNPAGITEQGTAATSAQNVNGFIPEWML